MGGRGVARLIEVGAIHENFSHALFYHKLHYYRPL